MPNYLSRDQLLARAQELQTDTVELPDGSLVLVRELTVDEAERLGFAMMDGSGGMDLRKARGQNTQIVLWATVDENGEQLFSGKDAAQVKSLSTGVVKAIVEKVLDLTGLTREPEAKPWSIACPHCNGSIDVDLVALATEYDEAQREAPKN